MKGTLFLEESTFTAMSRLPLEGRFISQHIVLNPGSSSSQLLETASQEIKKLNRGDILIICSGTNDLAINKSTLAFKNISNIVTKNNHTNITLVNIPYRYDTANTNTVNEGIEKFNKKLEKLIEASPHASFLKND